MLKFQVIPVTPFQQNCTLCWCDETRRGAVIDPGGDLETVLQVVAEQGITLEKILLTHGHIDHAGGVAELAKRCALPIEGPHQADAYWIEGLAKQGEMFGFAPAEVFTPDRWLVDGDTVQVGNETLQVLHCPGHTPGHVVFYSPTAKVAQVGDVLFQGSIGRTDFPGGDYQTLINSIKTKLFPLGDEVTFIPGHGPNSTLGQERMSNPFVADRRG